MPALVAHVYYLLEAEAATKVWQLFLRQWSERSMRPTGIKASALKAMVVVISTPAVGWFGALW